MKSKLNELRLDAGIARIENQQWLCVLDKETGMMIDPMIGLEKFAELIVKECAELTSRYQMGTTRLPDIIVSYNYSDKLEDVLKKHFGVEL